MADQAQNQFVERRKIRKRRRVLLWTLGVTVFLLLFVIVSQQLWLWNIVPLESASDTVVLYALSTLNFIAFVVFSFIFVRNLLKLRRERRERELGSKIKTRLLVYFIGISFLPIIAMAVFSYLFLNRSLEKWFSKLPEDVVAEAREGQREAVASQYRSLQETAYLLGVVLSKQPEADRQSTLNQMVARGDLSAVEIVDAAGNRLAQSRVTLPAQENAELDTLLYRARGAKDNIGESLVDGRGFDIVTAPLSPNQFLILATARRSGSDLNSTISGSQSEYQKLVARQRKVRWLGISTLGLMTLMLLFVSSWVAIYLARGIATPIKSLAEASNEVARGNLSHRVIPGAEDELALLAHSFNQMTAQLEENRRRIDAGSAELLDKNFALEERRNYIETVLQSLTTGVVSLDAEDRVTTINPAAARMLRLRRSQLDNSLRLDQLLGTEDRIVLERLLRRARRTGHSTEQAQLTGAGAIESGSLPVALTATALHDPKVAAGSGGVVFVIEDLSELLAAQRAAAWSEVARRMAHEIKNPLTPIQLSAERIAKSFHRNGGDNANGAKQNGSGTVGEEAASAGSRDASPIATVIDECTETITREVAGLKAMVDEFSRFARLPLARLEPANLYEIVLNAVALYEERLSGVELRTKLDPRVPIASLDSEQLRRLFVNLIDNALAALANVADERTVTVETKYDSALGLLIAEVTDTGQGIRSSDFKRLFQPYFSTRGGGTGLGLAIVQRIVLEHHGRIRAEANTPRGARFIIEIPVRT
ncbi:MAG: ATP-binding protein [Acidobacteriota bacterium]|nr:ATP-binding protein [Acidobacteriota bacterium]